MATPSLLLPEETISAEDLLVWGYEQFGDRFCLTCSWQKQSSVLVHMVSELGLPIDVVELDTQLFFRESYETRERLVERYGLNLVRPEVITVAEQHRREGPEPLGARPGPLLRDPQGRAARARARALRRLGVRHPPRPVARAAPARRRSSGRSVTASGSSTRSRTGTRSASGRTSTSTRFPTTRCTRPGTARSAASRAPARRARRKRSAQAAGPAPTSSSAASTYL